MLSFLELRQILRVLLPLVKSHPRLQGGYKLKVDFRTVVSVLNSFCREGEVTVTETEEHVRLNYQPFTYEEKRRARHHNVLKRHLQRQGWV